MTLLTFGGNTAHSRMELFAAVAAQRPQHIPGETFGSDTCEHVLCAKHLAHDEGEGVLCGRRRHNGTAGNRLRRLEYEQMLFERSDRLSSCPLLESVSSYLPRF